MTLKISDNLPEVYADSDRIRWVLIQLLDNAIKFTPEKGEVALTIMPFDKLVLFNIHDTGSGSPRTALVNFLNRSTSLTAPLPAVSEEPASVLHWLN